jgi:hypothetical protein
LREYYPLLLMVVTYVSTIASFARRSLRLIRATGRAVNLQSNRLGTSGECPDVAARKPVVLEAVSGAYWLELIIIIIYDRLHARPQSMTAAGSCGDPSGERL